MNPEEKPQPTPPQENTNENSSLKQIRTFQGDIAEALKKQQESLVSIQRAEVVRRGGAPEGAPRAASSRQPIFLILGSLILLILGGVGAWYAYNEFVIQTSAPIVDTPLNRFIAPNEEVDVEFALTDLNRENIISTLATARANASEGELRHIILRKKTGTEKVLLPTDEFINALGTRAQGSLVRAFGDLFMFGTLAEDAYAGEASTFIIIELSSFENAFAGMLNWENNLREDIGPLFSTAPLLRDLPEAVFTDLTDRNKDIRALILEGEPILLYSFFDNEKLIITDSLETLRTLLERLTREKLSR